MKTITIRLDDDGSVRGIESPDVEMTIATAAIAQALTYLVYQIGGKNKLAFTAGMTDVYRVAVAAADDLEEISSEISLEVFEDRKND